MKLHRNRKKNNFKKLISLVLVCCMTLSMGSSYVSAGELGVAGGNSETIQTETSEAPQTDGAEQQDVDQDANNMEETPSVTGQEIVSASKESEVPEITQTPEASQEPEVTQTPEASQEPEVTQTPGATQEPEATQTPEATQEPEATQTPEASQEPEATQTPEATQEPEATQTPEATQEPEATQTPEASQEPETTQTPESTQTPEPTQNPTEENQNTALPGTAEGVISEPATSDEDEDLSGLPTPEEVNALPEDMVGATMWKGAAAFAMRSFALDPDAQEEGNSDSETEYEQASDWEFGTRYSYQNERNMVLTQDSNVKYDISFHTNVGLSAGTVEIRVPLALYRYRGEGEQISQQAGELVIPGTTDVAVPKAPNNNPEEWTYSKNTPFNYYISEVDDSGNPTDESEIVFFNYRKVTAGTSAVWQVLYRNVDIMRSVDGSEWNLPAKAVVTRSEIINSGTPGDDPETEEGTGTPVIREWKERIIVEPLTGVVNSAVNLTNVTKQAYKESGKQYTPGLYTESQVENYINGELPEEFKGDNFNNWKYVVWQVTIQGTATQPWTMELAEIPGVTGKEIDLSQFRVVGYRSIPNSSYPHSLDEGVPFENREVELKPGEKINAITAAVKGISTVENPRMRFYLVTAYPADMVEAGNQLENKLTVICRPVDGKDEAACQTVNAAPYTYQNYDWTYDGNTIGMNKYSDISDSPYKTEKDYYGWLEAYSQAQRAQQDYGSLWFTSRSSYRGYGITHYIPASSENTPENGGTDDPGTDGGSGPLHGYKEGSIYEMASADDFLYADYEGTVEGVTKPVMLDWEDYYYSSVTVTQTDRGFDSANEETTDSLEFPEEDEGLFIYAMFGKTADGQEWTQDQKNTWQLINNGQPVYRDEGKNSVTYSFTQEEIAREPWRVMAVHKTAEYITECRIDVDVCLKASPSVELQKIMDAYREGNVKSLTLRNFSTALGRYKNVTDGTESSWTELKQSGGNFYDNFDKTFPIRKDTQSFYAESKYQGGADIYTYSADTLPVRGSASVTLYGLEKEADAFKRARTVVNDVAGGRVLVDYYLTAYDGYRVTDESTMGYLRNMGVQSPGKNYVMFCDLLPYGVKYDPSEEVFAGRLTQLDQDGYYKERINYWNDEDVAVTAEVLADWNDTGRDMVVFHIHYTGEDPAMYLDKKWMEGWGIRFRAYYVWSDKEQVENQYNISAFLPDVNYLEEEDWFLCGQPDKIFKEGTVPSLDTEWQVDGVYAPFQNASISSDDADAGRKDVDIMYACCPVREDAATYIGAQLHKEVRADSDTFVAYSDSAYVEEGKDYTYKITVETSTTALKNLVVFDHLENAAEERGTQDLNNTYFNDPNTKLWYGTLRGVNLKALDGRDVEPVIWYNAARNAATTGQNPVAGSGTELTPAGVPNSLDDLLAVPSEGEDPSEEENPSEGENPFGWYREADYINKYCQSKGAELQNLINEYKQSHSQAQLNALVKAYKAEHPEETEAEDIEGKAITRTLAMATVGSVAVDLRKTASGSDFVLPEKSVVSFEIEMTAPVRQDKGTEENTWYAFNNPSYYFAPNAEGSTSENNGRTQEGDSVRVRLGAGHALEIRKDFADKTQIPEAFLDTAFSFRVYRNVQATDKEGDLAVDGEGNPILEPQPLGNKAYTLWNRVEGTDGAEDSYVQVKDRPYATDENGCFTLKAGQRAVFENVADADRVIVEEEENLYWKAEDTQYAAEDYPDGNGVSGFETYLHKITNQYRNVLYVQKELECVPKDVELTEEQRTFTFQINVEGQDAPLQYCMVDSVRTNGTNPAILEFPDGEKIKETDAEGCFQIRDDWILALFLDTDSEYTLTEVITEGEKVTDNKWLEPDSVSGSISVGGGRAVIRNYYKWRDLYLTKEITHQDPEQCTEPFTFQLLKQVKTEDGEGNITESWEPEAGKNWTVLENGNTISAEPDSVNPDLENPEPENPAPDGDGAGQPDQETGISGTTDSEGKFTARCAGKVIKIEDLEAKAVYKIVELIPEGAATDEWDYQSGYMKDDVFMPFEEGEGPVVQIPLYADKAEAVIVNDYLKRPLSVTKTVLSEETLDDNIAFTMILAKGTSENHEFLGIQKYCIYGQDEWGQETKEEGCTDQNGSFSLKAGQTAVFEAIGREGEQFVIWEVQESHNGKDYPQLSPAGEETSLTLNEGNSVVAGAPLDVTIEGEGGSGEFLNGTPDLLIFEKEYVGADEDVSVDLVSLKQTMQGTLEQIPIMWDRMDRIEDIISEIEKLDEITDELKNKLEDFRNEHYWLKEEIENTRVNFSYLELGGWFANDLDVRVTLTVNDELWKPDEGDYITCIDQMNGLIYRFLYTSDPLRGNTWKLLRKGTNYTYNGGSWELYDAVVEGYEWKDTGYDAEAILDFDNGSFNIKPWMSYVVNIGSEVSYVLEEADPFVFCHDFVFSQKRPRVEGKVENVPVATLVNEVWLRKSQVEKRLTVDSTPVGTGKELVWRVERYNEQTGNWNAAEGIKYVVAEKGEEDKEIYVSSEAIQETGKDGKIRLTRDKEENDYLAVHFLLDEVMVNPDKLEDGCLRVVEVPEETDEAWGILVGYSYCWPEEMNGRNDMAFTNADVFVNSNNLRTLRIEKKVDEAWKETSAGVPFTMFLKQAMTGEIPSVARKDIPYKVYDTKTRELIHEDERTGERGEILLEAGQYAELSLPIEGEWIVSEAEGNDPGANQSFRLIEMSSKNDAKGVLYRADRNQMQIRDPQDGTMNTSIDRRDVEYGVMKVTMKEDGRYDTEWVQLSKYEKDEAGKWIPYDVEIPEYILRNGKIYRVTGIAKQAFKDQDKDVKSNAMRSVIIPDSVEIIEEGAFSDCEALTSVTIPGSVKTIETDAFGGCSSLVSVEIQEGVETIGMAAFEDCVQLSSVRIPNSVTTIREAAFMNCKSLADVNIPRGITTIEQKVFEYCIALKALIPEGYTDERWQAGQTGVLVIPSTVETISEHAFAESGLEELVIPETLKEIKVNAFGYCLSLEKATIKSEVNIESGVFSGNEYMIFLIDGSVGDIGRIECKELHVTSNGIVGSISENNHCESLQKITIDGKVESIKSSAFQNCQNLSCLSITGSVGTIEENAFLNAGLESVTVDGKVDSIKGYAFCNCQSLESVTVSGSVNSIGEFAFNGCQSLKTLSINEISFIDSWALSGGVQLVSVSINKVDKIGAFVFDDNENAPFDLTIYQTTVPEIARNAFYNTNINLHVGWAEDANGTEDSPWNYDIFNGGQSGTVTIVHNTVSATPAE